MVRIGEILKNKTLKKGFEIILIIFGLYLLYEIVKKMLGGSWSTEDIIIGLLIFNLGTIFTIGTMVAQLKSDHTHLKGQFKSMANDFKSHLRKK